MTDFTDTELPLDNTTDTTVEQYDPAHDYHALNAMLNLYDADGRIQFGKDKAAEREYVTGHVAANTKRFESTGERLRYLIDHQYYAPAVVRTLLPRVPWTASTRTPNPPDSSSARSWARSSSTRHTR